MRATMDESGSVVIQRQLREQIGLSPGEVDVVADEQAVRIAPVASQVVNERENGRLVIPATTGDVLTDEAVRSLRRR